MGKKILVRFKTPNAIIEAGNSLSDDDYDRLQDIAPSWTMYGECLTIEIDLETGEAIIVPPSSIPGN